MHLCEGKLKCRAGGVLCVAALSKQNPAQQTNSRRISTAPVCRAFSLCSLRPRFGAECVVVMRLLLSPPTPFGCRSNVQSERRTRDHGRNSTQILVEQTHSGAREAIRVEDSSCRPDIHCRRSRRGQSTHSLSMRTKMWLALLSPLQSTKLSNERREKPLLVALPLALSRAKRARFRFCASTERSITNQKTITDTHLVYEHN